MTNSEKDNTGKHAFKRADAFVDEPTGSAAMVNLDGQRAHDFADHPAPAGPDHVQQEKND